MAIITDQSLERRLTNINAIFFVANQKPGKVFINQKLELVSDGTNSLEHKKIVLEALIDELSQRALLAKESLSAKLASTLKENIHQFVKNGISTGPNHLEESENDIKKRQIISIQLGKIESILKQLSMFFSNKLDEILTRKKEDIGSLEKKILHRALSFLALERELLQRGWDILNIEQQHESLMMESFHQGVRFFLKEPSQLEVALSWKYVIPDPSDIVELNNNKKIESVFKRIVIVANDDDVSIQECIDLMEALEAFSKQYSSSANAVEIEALIKVYLQILKLREIGDAESRMHSKFFTFMRIGRILLKKETTVYDDSIPEMQPHLMESLSILMDYYIQAGKGNETAAKTVKNFRNLSDGECRGLLSNQLDQTQKSLEKLSKVALDYNKGFEKKCLDYQNIYHKIKAVHTSKVKTRIEYHSSILQQQKALQQITGASELKLLPTPEKFKESCLKPLNPFDLFNPGKTGEDNIKEMTPNSNENNEKITTSSENSGEHNAVFLSNDNGDSKLKPLPTPKKFKVSGLKHLNQFDFFEPEKRSEVSVEEMTPNTNTNDEKNTASPENSEEHNAVLLSNDNSELSSNTSEDEIENKEDKIIFNVNSPIFTLASRLEESNVVLPSLEPISYVGVSTQDEWQRIVASKAAWTKAICEGASQHLMSDPGKIYRDIFGEIVYLECNLANKQLKKIVEWVILFKRINELPDGSTKRQLIETYAIGKQINACLRLLLLIPDNMCDGDLEVLAKEVIFSAERILEIFSLHYFEKDGEYENDLKRLRSNDAKKPLPLDSIHLGILKIIASKVSGEGEYDYVTAWDTFRQCMKISRSGVLYTDHVENEWESVKQDCLSRFKTWPFQFSNLVITEAMARIFFNALLASSARIDSSVIHGNFDQLVDSFINVLMNAHTKSSLVNDKIGQFFLAYRFFQRALSIESWNELYRLFNQQQISKDEIRQCITRRPITPEQGLSMALCYLSLGEFKVAFDCCREITALSPQKIHQFPKTLGERLFFSVFKEPKKDEVSWDGPGCKKYRKAISSICSGFWPAFEALYWAARCSHIDISSIEKVDERYSVKFKS